MKSDKKPMKTVNKKCSPTKKKKMTDLKPPIRDTISETISFVIKGKLTPINPIIIQNKFDLIGRTNKKNSTCDKTTKKKKQEIKPSKIVKKKIKQPAKVKTKVQIETTKKVITPNSSKKTIEKKPTELVTETPNDVTKRNTKTNITSKNIKKKTGTKVEKTKKLEEQSDIDALNIKVKVSKPKKKKKYVRNVKTREVIQVRPKQSNLDDQYKKQQTIDELLKQVNEEILKGKKSVKIKKEKLKSKIKPSLEEEIVKKQEKKVLPARDQKDIMKIKTEFLSGKNSPNELPAEHGTEGNRTEDIQFNLPSKIKLEPFSDKYETEQKLIKNPIEQKPVGKLKGKKSFETDTRKKAVKPSREGKSVKAVVERKAIQKQSHKKLKTNALITIMKKRVISSKAKDDEDKKCKTKLFGFWNGPKRHRVASLNALAKVHCLYENETRGNMLDIIDEASKLAYAPRKDSVKAGQMLKIKKEEKQENIESETSSPLPTRTLRSVPGLRGAGKHWDMHDTSSSSDDLSDDENVRPPVKYVKKEKPSKTSERERSTEEIPKKPKKRCRKQTEIMMDLKDMVVRKRMASLNASAILAASYSLEKRQSRTIKSDDTDSYDGSSEEYFAASDTEIKQEDDEKKDDDGKLIEVHTTPNKKVAVILNQDTDVTITGVYVNSTTRSTHHEGYCSIAGMQYRISATSHTQTAATAVATETLLQSSSTSAQENSNTDSLPSSSKSYTPLDALSNMQPPPGPGIQHNHPVVHGQQAMGPPQHVLPMPPHQLSPGLRHSCSSAFSSPQSTPAYQVPSGPLPAVQGDPGFVHAGYYQPAGPLITLSHGGNAAAATHGQPPPPMPLSKAASLSEASPTSTTPSVASTHDAPPPPPSSTGGDSSDSEVVITSVTAAKDSIPPPPPAHHSVSYRYAHHQYPAPPPNYSYAYHSPYAYHTAPPHNPSYPPPPPHDLCYSSYGTHKYAPSYRRYLTSTQYYPAPGPQDIYSTVPPSSQNQQVVSASPTASGVSGPGSYPSTATAPGLHPPPTILETFPAPQAALVETYPPPPPPPHYYPPPTAYGSTPSCYTHSPTRAIPYINPTYQSCPCPMQSCPKNGLTGPLTGDSKRSNISSISKESIPLPPVALALPLEPNSVMGPPSPARGSAGMPPPPSPAGATYQPPPPPTKQESQSPVTTDDCKLEKKRKARIGKAMVRNNIAAGMQQNTMLLMCNPQTQNYVSAVKREIESPKEKEILEERRELCPSDEETKPVTENLPVPVPKTEEIVDVIAPDTNVPQEHEAPNEQEVQEKTIASVEEPSSMPPEQLQPVVSTVAENVKVKNMKRKISSSTESKESELTLSSAKKQKIGSYKCLIKKETNCIKINNGKRKLIEEPIASEEVNQTLRLVTKSKKPSAKRKLSATRDEPSKRLKVAKPLTDNSHNSKQRSKSKENLTADSAKDEEEKKFSKKLPVNSKSISKSSVAVLDNLFARNSIELTIESVVNETCLRTSPPRDVVVPKTISKCAKSNKEPVLNKKSINYNKFIQNKTKSECKKIEITRKSKCHEMVVPQAITKVPRRSLHIPRWSNGWRWEGEPYQSKVFINSDEMTAVRKCYPAMMHETGDKIVTRDCVLLKAGPRKNDLPFVAKIASLWENPEDGEMMMSLLWYYRPEHTEQGRLPTDQPDEVFASRHKDSNSVACIDDKCYVLTFNEYCRYRKKYKRIEEGIEEKTLPCIPNPEPYPRSHRQPPKTQVSPEMVFFCRRVYDFRQKRIMKNPA